MQPRICSATMWNLHAIIYYYVGQFNQNVVTLTNYETLIWMNWPLTNIQKIGRIQTKTKVIKITRSFNNTTWLDK